MKDNCSEIAKLKEQLVTLERSHRDIATSISVREPASAVKRTPARDDRGAVTVRVHWRG